MAQFIPFQPGVEVKGQSLLSIVNAIEFGKEVRLAILKKHGIENPVPDGWYSQEKMMNAFKEIADQIGNNTLFAIGKSILENVVFPPQIDDLEKALHSIDMAYQMHHRGGDTGCYKLVKFDSKKREAIMECKNPYPSEFDRGIISAVLRRFKPKDSFKYDVVLDLMKETRLKGAYSCTYWITW